MGIKEGLLALLSEEPKHGYQLKAEFEARTDAAWPLNVGQVYTTLDRLERDGLVAAVTEADEPERRRRYELTERGVAAQEAWFFASPDDADLPPRDGLAMKVLLACNISGVDPLAVIHAQRAARVEQLQAFRRRQREAGNGNLSGRLVADALAIKVESEVRWLDLCEERIVQHARNERERT